MLEHEPTKEDVIAYAKNEIKLETEKYKKEKEAKMILLPNSEIKILCIL